MPLSDGYGVAIGTLQGEWAENGTRQDGATLVQRQDVTIVAFLNKFRAQSDATDADGHPV